MYDYLDEVLKKLVVQIYNAFSRFRSLRFDELHILSETQDLSEELERIKTDAFFMIAKYKNRAE